MLRKTAPASRSVDQQMGSSPARDILREAPAPRRARPFFDGGAAAVATLTLSLFIAPMVIWAMRKSSDAHGTASGVELRMLMLCAGLSLVLPLIQIVLQIRRHGGGAVRGNRARVDGSDGAAGRIARAHRNLGESLLPFAIAVLAMQLADTSTRWTVAASVTFLAARLTHAASYALGITVIRSAAFYAGLIATAVILLDVALVRR